MRIKQFTFNPFSENTYVLYDDTKNCVIIDPGCNTSEEQSTLSSFISGNGLQPIALINTHCHIDHVLGNRYVCDSYGIELHAHEGEKSVLDAQPQVAMMYGIPYSPSPAISINLEEGKEFSFGDTKLSIILTPGHSPASISLYHEESKQLIAGDVLFQGSIGRTDLPGGNHQTLLDSIQQKLFTLPDDVIVYPGHGLHTHIGIEKRTNPFFQ